MHKPMKSGISAGGTHPAGYCVFLAPLLNSWEE